MTLAPQRKTRLSLNLQPTQTLWSVTSYLLGQTVGPRARYWYDNHDRQPFGMVVFQLVEAGELIWMEQGRQQRATPGQAVLFAYGEPTSYGLPAAPRPEYRTSFMNLAGAGLAEHWAHIRARHGSVITPGRPLVGQMLQLVDAARHGSGVDPLHQSRAVHQFVLDLLDHLEAQAVGSDPPVGQAVRWILARPTEPWSLKEVSARFGCSREHLIRVFTQRQGCTPGQFVARARLARALSLLVETDMKLADVAAQSGFGSTYTLARQVVQVTGVSPQAYRQRGRG